MPGKLRHEFETNLGFRHITQFNAFVDLFSWAAKPFLL